MKVSQVISIIAMLAWHVIRMEADQELLIIIQLISRSREVMQLLNVFYVMKMVITERQPFVEIVTETILIRPTNPNHTAIGIPNDCATCHTTAPGWAPASFGIHNNYYPLTGGHATIANDCFGCHNGNYNNTPNLCFGCHSQNYNQTTNPNHNAIGIPNDCANCHTTNPDWQPATFPTHNNYYALIGAHATIATDCFTCHNGNYNNTPNTCYACHTLDYNQTTNPPHQSAQFPTDCEMCHTQSVWDPSTFNHDGQYFPIYSGQHNGEWDQCSDCHTNPGNYAIFTCLTCHQQGETNSQHEGVSGYQYNSNACLACHPDGGNSKTIIDQFKKD